VDSCYCHAILLSREGVRNICDWARDLSLYPFVIYPLVLSLLVFYLWIINKYK
jgi:hypothetical protein